MCGKQVIMEKKKVSMRLRLKESYEEKKPYVIVMAVMIILQVLFVSYFFILKRKATIPMNCGATALQTPFMTRIFTRQPVAEWYQS